MDCFLVKRRVDTTMKELSTKPILYKNAGLLSDMPLLQAFDTDPGDDTDNGYPDTCSAVDEGYDDEADVDWSSTRSNSQTSDLFLEESADEDDEIFFQLARKLRGRSQSLKPAVDPIRHRSSTEKKIVRFADSLGLDLVNVRYFEKSDAVSYQPRPTRINFIPVDSSILFRFVPPESDPRFLDRVREQKIVLENCAAGIKCISGTARVANVAFEKNVTVRYTVNNWLTYEDAPANYIPYSSVLGTDRFSFCIPLPAYFTRSCRAEFALMMSVRGQEYWDNNFDVNYIVESV